MAASSQPMVWIDLEMTGLDIENCSIIEIATIVTDRELKIIAEGPNIAINVPEIELESMDKWNTTHHNNSGLVDRVRQSEIDASEAERMTLEFLRQHVKPGSSPLCGNSIWNDRKFLEKEMPKLADFLHYRMVDVTTVKILANNWYPNLPDMKKANTHQALGDIRESIAELRYYRDLIFEVRESED